jgi:hypothetical protein
VNGYDPSNAGYNNPATIARLQRRLDAARSHDFHYAAGPRDCPFCQAFRDEGTDDA